MDDKIKKLAEQMMLPPSKRNEQLVRKLLGRMMEIAINVRKPV